MNELLNQLDKSQLIKLLESIADKLGITLHSNLDPVDNKPTIMAIRSLGGRTTETFTVLNLDAMPRLTYQVSCVSTELRRLEFHVRAHSPQQAIDLCAQREDEDGNRIEPIDDEFMETEREDAWSAHPIG